MNRFKTEKSNGKYYAISHDTIGTRAIVKLHNSKT